MNDHFVEEAILKDQDKSEEIYNLIKIVTSKYKLKPQWDTILCPLYWQKFKSDDIKCLWECVN